MQPAGTPAAITTVDPGTLAGPAASGAPKPGETALASFTFTKDDPAKATDAGTTARNIGARPFARTASAKAVTAIDSAFSSKLPGTPLPFWWLALLLLLWPVTGRWEHWSRLLFRNRDDTPPAGGDE